MKQFFYLATIFLTLFTISSYTYASADYQLFEMQGKQGMKDKDGNVLIPAQYDELGWSRGVLEVINNTVGYKVNDKWGIITLDNEIVKQPEFTQLFPGNKTLLIAAKDGKVSHRDFLGVITLDGKPLIPFKYTSIELKDLRAIVGIKPGKNYLYGVVDLAGREILPIEYKEVKALGHLRYAVKNQEGKSAIFSDKGRQVIGFELDSISCFDHNVAIIYDNHLRGLIDIHGQIVEPLGKKDFKIDADGVKKLSFNEWALLDHKNQQSDTYYYDKIRPYDSSRLQVWANGRSWLIDNEKHVLTSEKYTALTAPVQGHFGFEVNNMWGVMKNDGELLIPARFDSLFFHEDMIYVREKLAGVYKWSLYDNYGVKKSAHHYDQIRERTAYYFPVSRQGHWGFINRSGEEVIHCVYDAVSPFVEGMSVVKFHGEKGVIDKFGEWVVLPQKADLTIINDEFYLAKDKQLTILKSFKEGTVYFTENYIEIKDNYLLEHLADGRLWKIDFEGRIFGAVGTDRYQEVREPSEGFYAVKIDDKYGFIDAQNRLRIANRYDEVGPFQEDLAAFKLLGKWGFLDKRERIIIQPQFTYSSVFKKGLAIVSTSAGAGLINKEGDEVCAFDYDEIQRLENERYLAKKNNKYGLISETGRVLINARYDALNDLNNGFAIVQRSGKYGLITIHGVDVIPTMYDELFYDEASGKYLGMKKSEWEKVNLP